MSKHKKKKRTKRKYKYPPAPPLQELELAAIMVEQHMEKHKKLGMTVEMAVDDLVKLGYLTKPKKSI